VRAFLDTPDLGVGQAFVLSQSIFVLRNVCTQVQMIYFCKTFSFFFQKAAALNSTVFFLTGRTRSVYSNWSFRNKPKILCLFDDLITIQQKRCRLAISRDEHPRIKGEGENQKDEKNKEKDSYMSIRLKNLEELKERSGRNDILYPPFASSISVEEFIRKWSHLTPGEVAENAHTTLCGRIQNKRIQSKRLFFYDIIDNGSHLQVMCSQKRYQTASVRSSASPHTQTATQIQSPTHSEPMQTQQTQPEDDFMFMNRILKRGDIIAVRGVPGRTDKGELSLFATELILLSPCLHDLPEFGYLMEKAI
jgi:hypothetical protein